MTGQPQECSQGRAAWRRPGGEPGRFRPALR